MSEDQKVYHELEGMQELGLIKDVNISEILDSYKELEEEIEIETNNEELENHMIIGEYYTEGGNNNE